MIASAHTRPVSRLSAPVTLGLALLTIILILPL
jgi:hypothetical protein